MSHWTSIKCQIKDLKLAEEILKQKGFIVKRDQKANGYNGQTEEIFPLIFQPEKEKFQGKNYSGGINAAGEIIFDSYCYRNEDSNIIQNLPKNYITQKALQQLKIQGFAVQQKETESGIILTANDFQTGKKIEINIDNQGNSEIHVSGVVGKSCKDLTKDLEKELGEIQSIKLNSDYYGQVLQESIHEGLKFCG